VADWRSQQYAREATDNGVPSEIIRNAVATAETILAVNNRIAPVLTLRHLAHDAGADYGVLRNVVRREIADPYKIFRIRKRASVPGKLSFRVIAVPDVHLMRAQRWIVRNILQEVRPHPASVAFSSGDTVYAAAEPHRRAAWLVKLDVQSFFESISEISVFRVFRGLGYQPLVAFELARICTRLGSPTSRRLTERWRVKSRRTTIKAYQTQRMGHLPQGAPTSPMLANLAMRDFDAALAEIAHARGLTYTRYADDLAFSTTSADCSRDSCAALIGDVYAVMAEHGLSPNVTKARVSPPGSRKIVLGLNVDREAPRLTRDFKDNLRRHLHYLLRDDVGPSGHARARGFASTTGLRHHVEGLVSFALQIEPSYGRMCAEKLARVSWPF
jgi:hypothetical protein